MTEKWIKVKEFNDYEVSNFGNIKSLKCGREKLLSPMKSKNGYLVAQFWENGKNYKRYMHRLVAEAFIPNIESKSEVNHIDGDKHNNYYTNLEWLSHYENMQHGYINKLMPHGENSPLSKITSIELRQLLWMATLNYTHEATGKAFGLSQGHTTNIISGKKWKY